MATALWPIQAAVYSKLSADPALSALVTGVFDSVPEGQDFPYVSLGSITETADDAHNQRGLTVLLVVHTWSKQEGTKEAAQVSAAVDNVLDRQPLSVAGWTNVSVALEQMSTVPDPDPAIRHVNARYRVWLTKA